MKSEVMRNYRMRYSAYANNLSMYGVDMAMNKMRHTVGHEFYIQNSVFNNGKNFKKFMKHYVKNFDASRSEDTGKPTPYVELVRLSRLTYMYVATGKFIPGKLDAALLNDESTSVMYVFIAGKSYKHFATKLAAAIEKDKLENSTNTIYVVNKVGNSYDIVSMGFEGRPLDTLIYSFDEKKLITEHLDKFAKNMDFYKSKSIMYKTGILLYGEPGTGKSSLVKAIATQYHRNICQVSVSNLHEIDFSVLTIMLNQDDDKYIVLFEDIDTLFLNRDSNMTDKDYLSMINKLLQFLDSNTSPTDVIFIATTNHVDKLDEALLREGRFDLKVEVKALERDDVQKFMNMLECDKDIHDIIQQYGDAKNGLYNQSRLQNIIVRGKEDAEDAQQ